MASKNDRLSALGWAIAGATITVASWRMDRLQDRGINPWSVPGLTPGLAGLGMLLLAAVLATQRQSAQTDGADGSPAPPTQWSSLALSLLLCLGFGGLALGHGLPFVVLAALFVFCFISLFSWPRWRAESGLWKGLAQTAAVSALTAFVISWLFESVFLVRLP